MIRWVRFFKWLMGKDFRSNVRHCSMRLLRRVRLILAIHNPILIFYCAHLTNREWYPNNYTSDMDRYIVHYVLSHLRRHRTVVGSSYKFFRRLITELHFFMFFGCSWFFLHHKGRKFLDILYRKSIYKKNCANLIFDIWGWRCINIFLKMIHNFEAQSSDKYVLIKKL